MKLHNRVIASIIVCVLVISIIPFVSPKAQALDITSGLSLLDAPFSQAWFYDFWQEIAYGAKRLREVESIKWWYDNDKDARNYINNGYVPWFIPINPADEDLPFSIDAIGAYVLYNNDNEIVDYIDRFAKDDEGNIIIAPVPPKIAEPDAMPTGNKKGSATQIEFPYYEEVGKTVNQNGITTQIYNTGDTIYGNVIDLANGVLNDYANSTIYDIGGLTYNPVTNNYTCYVINNEYNYTYNIQYTYNYTYVTYIGSSAEYKGAYQLYYELPDGRSSADLTADEVAGISLLFDVVNYDKVYTDTHTRALFHFDGDWKDSSYYSNVSEIKWINNASITYLESNSFNGSIYFPEGPIFRIKYGGNSLRPNYQAMTIQFRIYFNKDLNNPYEVNNVGLVVDNGRFNLMAIRNDGYICLIQRPIQNTFIQAAVLPSGVWSDVAIVCHGNLLNELYLNGVKVQSVTLTNSDWTPYTMTGEVEFSFTNMKNYMQLDEIRIVDFAVYSSNYTPSPVPFDTNNVFVLPNLNGTESLTVAIQSDYSITGYRVGGVRPTFPNKGMVYMPVENSRVIDCQIYNGSYWESVECRLWTGERWIPLWAFDVITLMDLYDIAGSVADLPISSETGFWAWFQKQWTHFREWYSNLKIGSSKMNVDLDKHVEEGSSFSLLGTLGDILSSLVKTASSLATTIFDGLFSGAASAISGFTSSFSSDSSVLEFANYEGADIWD